MKKIAIVIADLVLGGGQRSALNLATALSKNHDVTVLVFQDSYRQYTVPCNLVNLDCPDLDGTLKKAASDLRKALQTAGMGDLIIDGTRSGYFRIVVQ